VSFEVSSMQGSVRAVRVAVWGIGAHARKRILPALAACPSTVLAGITTRDQAVARDVAASYSCPVWSSPEAMLASADVDVVYLATPIGLHAAQGAAVLRAGKHLWCEKSLAANLAGASNLIELSRRMDLSVCEAFMYTYHPQFERVLAIVAGQQTLGRLFSITSRFSMPQLDRPGFRHSHALGGGALLDMACYPVSLALRLTSALETPRVRLCKISSAPGFEVDLAGYACLEFADTTVAFLEWGFGRAYMNEMTVSAENGSLHANYVFSKRDGLESSIEVRDLKGASRTEVFPATDAFVCMFRTFARATYDEALRESLRRDAALQANCLAALQEGIISSAPAVNRRM
jgi:dTDP-3,4-didehydro-2,6-dideoxy-alpha-D-glucose 3-reductase